MHDIRSLRAAGLFDARVPRYTSYPPATAFVPLGDTGFQRACLAALDPGVPISVYVHIPFCERLCWFCACQTQGTTNLHPVLAYLDTVEAELQMLRAALPPGVRMARMHWGGGTPTILPPALIHRLAGSIAAVIPPAETFDFSVEIDPTMVDEAKIAALAEAGLTRASIGIQDFAPEVQEAIGRKQSLEQTRACVADLRRSGIGSLNADLVYGLPHQTPERFAATVAQVLELEPDRIALFGYAHVPHMSRRQKLIRSETLPDGAARHHLAAQAAAQFAQAGFDAIGIDHFARPDDGLARAAAQGHLRRNFQGYTDDTCAALVGIGASSISSYPQGIVQNAAMTPAYAERIRHGTLAGARGHQHTAEDRLRARAIEMLMCDFRLNMPELRARFGDDVAVLDAPIATAVQRFADFVAARDGGLEILPQGRVLTRLVAALFDGRTVAGAGYSQAS